MDVDEWWHPLVAAFPSLLAAILIFLDQQITSVIVNRKEHKLKVPAEKRTRGSLLLHPGCIYIERKRTRRRPISLIIAATQYKQHTNFLLKFHQKTMSLCIRFLSVQMYLKGTLTLEIVGTVLLRLVYRCDSKGKFLRMVS